MGALSITDAILRSSQLIEESEMVAVKQNHSRFIGKNIAPTIQVMLATISVESLFMIIGYKTLLYYVALLLPFRIMLWSMILQYQLTDGAKKASIGHFTLLCIPYLVAMCFFSEWFLQLELSKLSYLTGLLFTPLFIIFCSLYSSTKSVGVGLELMCIGTFIGVLAIQTMFHDALVAFWHTLMSPYYKVAVDLYKLNISNQELNQFLQVAASTMTSNVVIHYFLSPALMATLAVVYFGRHTRQFKDWLSLKLSWSAFTIVMPLFFISYLLVIVQQNHLFDLSYLPLSTMHGYFEIVRFMPAVCGLSIVHHWLASRYSSRPKIQTIGFVATSLIFYFFGTLFYPICSFLGLIDRVSELRKSTTSAKR